MHIHVKTTHIQSNKNVLRNNNMYMYKDCSMKTTHKIIIMSQFIKSSRSFPLHSKYRKYTAKNFSLFYNLPFPSILYRLSPYCVSSLLSHNETIFLHNLFPHIYSKHYPDHLPPHVHKQKKLYILYIHISNNFYNTSQILFFFPQFRLFSISFFYIRL